MTLIIGKDVPWNAAWTGEDRHEVRPCRYAQGKLAIWQPFAPGDGRPVFAKPHSVRQRKSIAEMRCTVCGDQVPEDDAWWYPRGGWQDGWWMSPEAPVHGRCADLAAHACPVLRKAEARPIRFPAGAQKLFSLVGGEATERDFGLQLRGKTVVGHLKLAWRHPYFLREVTV